MAVIATAWEPDGGPILSLFPTAKPFTGDGLDLLWGPGERGPSCMGADPDEGQAGTAHSLSSGAVAILQSTPSLGTSLLNLFARVFAVSPDS